MLDAEQGTVLSVQIFDTAGLTAFQQKPKTHDFSVSSGVSFGSNAGVYRKHTAYCA